VEKAADGDVKGFVELAAGEKPERRDAQNVEKKWPDTGITNGYPTPNHASGLTDIQVWWS
jgi:hypothetical protein